MSEIAVVQGDTLPDIVATIYEEGGSPVDLTGATVNFQMRKPDDRRYTVNRPAALEDAVAGKVRFTWLANDLTTPGTYQAQWEVNFPDGKIQTTRTPSTIVVRRQ